MNLLAALAPLIEEIAARSARIGRRVTLDPYLITDRSDDLDLGTPGFWSSNRSCRLVRAADDWIAVNLPREDDRWLVPAWIGCDLDAEPWAAIDRHARENPAHTLLSDARLLGLPVARVGEIRANTPSSELRKMGAQGVSKRAVRVLDLSAMWAGPLCGAILAQAGADVIKLENPRRPDAARMGAPILFRRLNGAKQERRLDWANTDDLARLRAEMIAADVVITSARPRAFEQKNLTPAMIFAENPNLVWVATSGYGWTGNETDRVAFGDDAAAAGGLVRWNPNGEPHFLGDALADPIAGLSAAAGALRALELGGGYLVDAAMARSAAGIAAALAPHNADAG